MINNANPEESVTMKPNAEDPEEEGIPVMRPLDDRDRPRGSVPETRLKEYGGTPPVNPARDPRSAL